MDVEGEENTVEKNVDTSQENTDISTEKVQVQKIIPDFQTKPKLLSTTDFGPHFTRGCKWSPDGLCILVCSDDHSLRIFDLPPEKSINQVDDINHENGTPVELDKLKKAAVEMKEGESVYDYQWYPLMNSRSPETCCIATTSQHQPIHLYDAFDGHIRATYRCFDHLDEMVAARSLRFNPSGTKLFAGLKNQIRIFDVAVPGRDCETVKTFDKKEGGLGGIISAIAFNPSMPDIFALASYNKSSAVYLDPRAQLLCVLEGQKGGITQIEFSPDGTKLFAGGRKDNQILIWDMRNPGTLFGVLQREVNTNQRIYFDIESNGRYVFSGNTDGSVTVWDLNQSGQDGHLLKSAQFQNMHTDAVSGCSLHPYLPYLATSSGQRHVKFPVISDDDSDEKSEDDDEDFKENLVENTLKLWYFDRKETQLEEMES